MTKSELYNIILDCLGTPRTMADSERYSELGDKLWGIIGTPSGIPSNLPSKGEFCRQAHDIYSKADFLTDTFEKLYDWLLEQLHTDSVEVKPAEQPRSGYCRTESIKDADGTITTASIDEEPTFKEIPFDLETALEHPEWVYTLGGYKVENLTTMGSSLLAGLVKGCGKHNTDGVRTWNYKGSFVYSDDEGQDRMSGHCLSLILRKPTVRTSLREKCELFVAKNYLENLASWEVEDEIQRLVSFVQSCIAENRYNE